MRAFASVCVALSIPLLVCTARAQSNLATAQLLTEYVNSTGARCLDGTPALYWLQTTGSDKWVFDIMGGGCE